MSDRALKAALFVGLVLCVVIATGAAYGATYKVGVYYFGVWSASSCNVCGGGNTDWWKGARDYYNGDIDPPWQSDDFSYLLPALGFYDNSQRATLEKQVRQAKANGIQFFNFYWYWGSDLNGGQGGEKYSAGLDTYLTARNTADLEFAISITSHPWGNLNISANHAPRAVDLIIQQYISQPHYLKTSDGRPVVFLLDTRGIKNGSQSDVLDFIALLNQQVVQQLGVSPFIVINAELNNLNASDPYYLDVKNLSSVQGYSCLNYFGVSLSGSTTVGSFVRYNNNLTGVLGGFNNKPMIPCYMTDFNEKPRTRVGVPSYNIRYLNDWSVSELNRGLTNVRSFVNGSSQGVVNNHVLLYAWNEWREGGVNVEPSERDGNRTLAQVSSVFSLATSGDSQCKKYGNCTHNTYLPTGTLDVANCTRIAGWARDQDTSYPIKVHLYKDAPYGQGGTFVTSFTASNYRGDLPFLDKYHGFSVTTPAAFKTGQPVKVYAYGININANGVANGSNPLLNGVPKTVTCSP